METVCKFVSTRGLLKSCDVHFNDPQSDVAVISHLYEMIDKNNIFPGMSIYVNAHSVVDFIKYIMPKIFVSFFLVSGDSDLTTDINNNDAYKDLVQNEYLIKWLSQNIISKHPKIIQMPIGLNYHDMAQKNHYNIQPIKQEELLLNLRKKMLPFYERNRLIFVNFCIRGQDERQISIDQIPSNLLDMKLKRIERDKLWSKYIDYCFILSPKGCGHDCFRTWEALMLGCIPIVKREGYFTDIFDELPVLIVNVWSSITKELLDETIINFRTREFNYNKLTLKFWTNLFEK